MASEETPPTDRPLSADLPPRDGDAPLHELPRDELSVFLYEALITEELLEVMRELGLSVPGYRNEALHDAEKADIIADEIRARPERRSAVLAQLRAVYEFPALDNVALPKSVADEVALLSLEGDAPVRMLWRLLADPSPAIRESGRAALRDLVRALYGPAPESPAGTTALAVKPTAAAGSTAPAAPAKEARRARAEAARAKDKAEGLKAQLKSIRAELADAQKQAAAHRKASEKLNHELQKAQHQLKEAKAKPQRAALDHAQKELADLTARASAMEERARRTAEERDALAGQLEALRKQQGDEQRRPQAAAASASDEDETPQEVPSTWILPRFTREFYDSLEGWEPRIQRAAFKQAYLLAENHRHPSLRAIPLEGVPGYYRVRIATDVRLIYRRTDERQRDVEILSLIDREDLDRYVRQAKTR